MCRAHPSERSSCYCPCVVYLVVVVGSPAAATYQWTRAADLAHARFVCSFGVMFVSLFVQRGVGGVRQAPKPIRWFTCMQISGPRRTPMLIRSFRDVFMCIDGLRVVRSLVFLL